MAEQSAKQTVNWAADLCAKFSPTAFNNTVSIPRDVIEIGIDAGPRHEPGEVHQTIAQRQRELADWAAPHQPLALA